ncbi:MAG: hypothetical protein KGL53_16190, partial [Elusimicrobia bacterium]|nr:hypothetical protein [Elusimicrobiota bacterium]
MPDAGPPDDPELLLENVASLDTARMTLRWALERIRGLERAHAETQQLLQASYDGRQKAEGELSDFKKSVDERLRKLAEKERFVSDMQRVLNDLFKGDVDVAEFVKRRQALDEERAHLEASVRRRVEEAESAHKREVEENSKRLAEMEGVYSASLADAQRRFHAELERVEAEQAAALKAERERYDQFRTEAHAEGARTAEEYQRRLLVFEHEYAGKRRQLADDLERLKERLGSEAQAAVQARDAEHARAEQRWAAERAALEERLAERERLLASHEKALKDAEAAYFSRDEELRRVHAAEIERLRSAEADAAAAQEAALAEAREEVARREAAFQAERMTWVRERNELRAAVAAEYEGVLAAVRAQADQRLASAAHDADALRRRLAESVDAFEAERARLIDEQTQLRRRDAEKFSEDVRALETRFHEHELELRRDSEADLEALRRHFEDALQRQRVEARQSVESHAQEVQALRARLRTQQEELTQALADQERRRVAELAAA